MARRNRRRSLPGPFTVTIESLSHEGRGICHHNGKVVFVFAALPGEVCRVQICKTTRTYAEANVLEVLEPSAQRIEPHCPHFSVCGGCSMQHLSSEDQLRYKQDSVAEMFEHAGIAVGEWLPVLQAESWGYRRKARLGVRFVQKKGRLLIGFRERNKPYLADMQQCPVLIPDVGEHLDSLIELISGLNAREKIAQIEVAADDDHVMLVLRHLEPLAELDLLKLTEFARARNFWIQLQPGGLDSVYPLYPEQQQLKVRPLADDTLQIRFTAGDFTQVNARINQLMVAQALSFLDIQPQHKVLDLFCGLGNFTLPIARRAAEVTGVEGDQAMVERARQNALDNGIGNTRYHAADLEAIDGKESWLRQRYDKVLLDPPRPGAAAMVEHLPRTRADTLVYVSCQPTTLVRDAQQLCASGYRLSHLGLMDMFPQTAHIESMAVFHRR